MTFSARCTRKLFSRKVRKYPNFLPPVSPLDDENTGGLVSKQMYEVLTFLPFAFFHVDKPLFQVDLPRPGLSGRETTSWVRMQPPLPYHSCPYPGRASASPRLEHGPVTMHCELMLLLQL